MDVQVSRPNSAFIEDRVPALNCPVSCQLKPTSYIYKNNFFASVLLNTFVSATANFRHFDEIVLYVGISEDTLVVQ